jgi:hypothetical protein
MRYHGSAVFYIYMPEVKRIKSKSCEEIKISRSRKVAELKNQYKNLKAQCFCEK